MEKRQQLDALEGRGRLVWQDRQLPVRYDVTINQYQDVGSDGSVRLAHRTIEARVEAADQELLAQANGREDLVLYLADGRWFPCILREAQGSAGWLVSESELSARAQA
jgi:hypothetical protein